MPIQEAMRTQTSEFDGALKIHMFPNSTGEILVRLENIADLFDQTPAETPYFNLKQYATQLYMLSNNGAAPASVTITERTLGNNQDWDEWLQERYQWKSEASGTGPSWPSDQGDELALQPQRIRLFKVVFKSSQEINMVQ